MRPGASRVLVVVWAGVTSMMVSGCAMLGGSAATPNGQLDPAAVSNIVNQVLQIDPAILSNLVDQVEAAIANQGETTTTTTTETMSTTTTTAAPGEYVLDWHGQANGREAVVDHSVTITKVNLSGIWFTRPVLTWNNNSSDPKATCGMSCFGVKQADGSYDTRKFDHIRRVMSERDWKNCFNGYDGIVIPSGGTECIYVELSYDGRLMSAPAPFTWPSKGWLGRAYDFVFKWGE